MQNMIHFCCFNLKSNTTYNKQILTDYRFEVGSLHSDALHASFT